MTGSIEALKASWLAASRKYEAQRLLMEEVAADLTFARADLQAAVRVLDIAIAKASPARGKRKGK